MATSRPFAYNPGGSLSGTLQVGSVSVGTPTIGFESTGLEWWNGPDEDLGYVIALPAPLDNQDTPVPGHELYLDPTHKANDIVLSNSDQTAYQQFGYQMSVLGTTQITGGDKTMFSVLVNLAQPLALTASHFIGFGLTSMFYQGNPYDGYPGNDVKSIGINAIGEYWYGGSRVSTGLPEWTHGDVVDIAIEHPSNLWIRVNGGFWNNNPASDPSTRSIGLGLNGLSDFYPVLCPGYEGTMTILNVPKYGYPDGFGFLGHTTASVGFVRTNTKSDPLFIELVNSKFSQTFTTIGECLSYLDTTGYWNSYPV
jgi:hypothetical protein